MNDRGSSAELLITGARVYTADPIRPWAEALVMRGNRLAFVGTAAEARSRAGASATHVHVDGGLALPGLHDSHLHMTQAAFYRTLLDLQDVETLPELQARLREYATSHPDAVSIEGYGLRYEPLSGLDQPERLALDAAVADRPVVLRCFDGHTSWANSAALRDHGLAHGADLPHPRVVIVDPESGLATGRMKEKGPKNLVIPHLSTPSAAERDAQLLDAMRYLNSLGITSVQNMDGDPERLAQYERLREGGLLSVRANHYLSVRQDTPRGALREFADLTRLHTGAWNHARGVKICIDGVAETKTALMLTPYCDGSGDSGGPDFDLDLFRQYAIEADRLGMDIATHAIGDRGVRLTLDAYEAAMAANGVRAGRRHRVEHIELCDAADLPRFARLGITASMQPVHAVPGADPRGAPWAQLIGPAREPRGFPWRAIVETGARLSFGSDWPVVTPDPRLGLHAAVTRTTRAGLPPGGWHPQQSITLAQALDAYTRGAAYSESREAEKGILREGMLADVTVFARDLFAVAPPDITDVGVALTVVDGRIVYQAP